MQLKLKEKTLIFEETPVNLKKINLHSPFITKNNKKLAETLEHPRYSNLQKQFTQLSNLQQIITLTNIKNEK